MTLASIMRLALRQLDENPADIEEYRDVFTAYANQGYVIALRQYAKPYETVWLRTDENGCADLPDSDILRIVSLRDDRGRDVLFAMDETGEVMRTQARNAELTAVCEMRQRPLDEDRDEPKLPAEVHQALADYICYKHLSCGNLAKQSRAQHFRNAFYAQLQMLAPRPSGGVTGFKHFYTVTDSRWEM